MSRAIGLIVQDLADPFFSVVSHVVQESAGENGYLVWLAAFSLYPIARGDGRQLGTILPTNDSKLSAEVLDRRSTSNLPGWQ